MTEKELMLCPFCGALLSKDGDVSDSFCGNVNCPFSGISILDEWWGGAFCWKELSQAKDELDGSKTTIKYLQKAIKDRDELLLEAKKEIEELKNRKMIFSPIDTELTIVGLKKEAEEKDKEIRRLQIDLSIVGQYCLERHVEAEWKSAALRIGEDFASVGPIGYYAMDAQRWLTWALSALQRFKESKEKQG